MTVYVSADIDLDKLEIRADVKVRIAPEPTDDEAVSKKIEMFLQKRKSGSS